MTYLLQCAMPPGVELLGESSKRRIRAFIRYVRMRRTGSAVRWLCALSAGITHMRRYGTTRRRAAGVVGTPSSFFSSLEGVRVMKRLRHDVRVILQRLRWRYQERAYRSALLEAGHLAQNRCLAATSLGIGCVPLAPSWTTRLTPCSAWMVNTGRRSLCCRWGNHDRV
ncbi:MAG: hypothetical protein C0183_04235 [Roseiflexus castenholzii]|uniref:nitroreductase family protein n=1 Tax=Roseiflexus castenholzii TaxID=120962 RepID=UPI000CBEFCAF|nr:MAG: hypothetical protein C0183_04235 [Roseiflexus castenholzii]